MIRPRARIPSSQPYFCKGNYQWTSTTRSGQLFHVGTIPDKSQNIYVCDMRMMVHYDFVKGCFMPLVVYARKARKPVS